MPASFCVFARARRSAGAKPATVRPDRWSRREKPRSGKMGGNIFSGVINGRGTALMMIGMLVFAVAWEAFTNFLDIKVRWRGTG